MFYENTQQAIDCLKAVAALYPNINELLNNYDYIRWQRKLEKSSDFEFDLIEPRVFNLLNLLSTVHIEKQYPQFYSVGTPIVANLERWLACFPELLKDVAFHGKIKNLDDTSFLSTLSELLVAEHFRLLGYKIRFEHKFSIPATGGNRDIDLTIESPTKETVHIEIYSPSMKIDDGFGRLDDSDIPFSKKVAFKMNDKFGNDEISGLSGKILLAVDTYKIDMFSVRKQILGKNNDALYSEMVNYLPQAVHGYLFFYGNINAVESFIFEKLIFKPENGSEFSDLSVDPK
ncbi:hypothetical protein [Sphingobacterium faecale]|uniref:Restriction endonuclease n=1 Tax=Sphingobacterium faecale TaxID=2803775 RepID=A0ABS1R5X7_9SPHI|nr:hypothetical protein [Sphingobacterium faecale]MBL1410106.1 hypothetical protein [Sphingobacterium faecale]